MKNKLILGLGLLSLVFLFGCINNETVSEDAIKVVQFKDAQCGCCTGHAAFLKGEGFEVSTVPTANMQAIKQEHNIPSNMQSCHTEIIEGYFVEGHVPIEAINKLLDEKPDIDGIALPGMPSGSPGMPGTKRGTWTIYAIKDGQATEFMRV